MTKLRYKLSAANCFNLFFGFIEIELNSRFFLFNILPQKEIYSSKNINKSRGVL
jgi:hypothetical protein